MTAHVTWSAVSRFTNTFFSFQLDYGSLLCVVPEFQSFIYCGRYAIFKMINRIISNILYYLRFLAVLTKNENVGPFWQSQNSTFGYFWLKSV